ncbi:TPA: MutH/Sau3AI family endonuclease [Neisseria meningitidis]|uniref:MutH/Sau3AI family endonuclease n=1 Tax=Neisseria meningitidis TaxID=487 RepID=UPI000C32D34E|nr:MutH/Sau3AI family endonuclease [Neisseria meningitidis]
MANHIFKRTELESILNKAVGKTLGEVDKNKVFGKTIGNPKITGIAGDVVEQSVLGYPADSKSEPDLLVDGIPVKLKTTGLKKVGKRDKSGYRLAAKEPMSITAVSLDKIAGQTDFYQSPLWHKLREMLLVYYLYDSPTTVAASEYADFPIQGFHFYRFSPEDRKIIENDWKIVRDFVANVINNNLDKETEYPKISKLRNQMAYLDTAPKYPNNPRFRLKTAVVTTIARSYFGKEFAPLLPQAGFSSFQELDKVLSNLSVRYRGKTISEIADDLGVPLAKNGKIGKQASSIIIARMFSNMASKLEDIELFNKFDICYKTVTLTQQGKRTEDIKFLKVDFQEWADKDIDFEASFIYSFFAGQKFLFAVFEEQKPNDLYENNVFIGFKRIAFDDDFLNGEVRKTWERIRELINQKKLISEKLYRKDGSPKMNKTGIQQEVPNFPKAGQYAVFLRGTGSDSTEKPFSINGIRMYHQNFWLKGSYLAGLLDKADYL